MSAMLDNLTKKLATKMGRSVKEAAKEAAEPIKNGVKQAANNKVDLYSRILRMGVLIFLFIDGTRRVTDTHSHDISPNQIIINNYMDGKDKGR